MMWLFIISCTPDPIPTEKEIVEASVLATPHLEEFYSIAVQHDGNRAAGTLGYDASVAYVEKKLQDFGFETRRQSFSFPFFMVLSPAELSIGDDALTEEIMTFTYSGGGEGAGAIWGVDVLIPPQGVNESTSGCQSSDFSEFPVGSVAVLQRGSCTFYLKAKNAQEAGASLAIIFNEGQNGRQDLVEGTLGDFDIDIPVLGTTYQGGLDLLAREGDMLQFSVSVDKSMKETENIWAEIGNPDNMMMIGAHLDSVVTGPGVNDNASGVSLLLGVAEYILCKKVGKGSEVFDLLFGEPRSLDFLVATIMWNLSLFLSKSLSLCISILIWLVHRTLFVWCMMEMGLKVF